MNERNGQNRETDYYSRKYREQLERYSQMDGTDYTDEEDVDLSFSQQTYPDDGEEYDGYNAYGEPRNTVRTDREGAQRSRTSSKGGGSPSKSKPKSNSPKKSTNSSRKSSPKKSTKKNPKNTKSSQKKKTVNTKSNSSKRNEAEKMSKEKERQRKKKSSPVGIFFKSLLVILAALLLIINLVIFRYLGMVDYVDSGERLVTTASMKSDKVQNILLIGSDTRSPEERGRTDSMILLSINRQSKEIVMTSFMRDMYVEIPGHGSAKMNAAYVYGGAELLMDTIELNFDIEIEKYIYIDFFAFVDIVDAVGGIELDISDEEAEAMSAPMNEQNMYLGKEFGTDNLTSGGKGLKLNGNQALAYARTRYVGNADFERTQRQRTVITQILKKAKTLSLKKLDNFAKVCLGNLRTNMSKSELYFLTVKAPFIAKYHIRQLRIPEDGAYVYGDHNGQSTLDIDLDVTRETLRKEIYGE